MNKQTKSPAFLFYVNDFTSGTQFFTDAQVGIYIRLLCAQHQHSRLSEKQVLHISKTLDEDIMSKFKKDDKGLYYNERLEEEIEKRNAFSESRKSNRNKANNEELHIYFIKNPETGLIKIGSSVDVERRLIELKRQYNSELELLFISEKCSQKKEAELHKIFSEKRKFSEWFSLSDNDIDLIKSTHIKEHMNNHMSSHMDNDNEIEIEDSKKERHLLQIFISKLSQVSKMKTQPTSEECEKLKLQFSQKVVEEVLLQMDNKPNLLKKYISVYATAMNWCKNYKAPTGSIAPLTGEALVKEGFGKLN